MHNMKTVTIIGADLVKATDALAFGKKDLVIEGSEQMSISDGYHTIDELYEHRYMLYLALCNIVNTESAYGHVWKSKKNSDGSEWDGWFLLGIGKDAGKQVTYHLPIKFWDDVSCEELPVGIWDGHTSLDVLTRLKTI